MCTFMPEIFTIPREEYILLKKLYIIIPHLLEFVPIKDTENHPLECVTSGGKSRIIRFLNQYKNKRVLIIADAAALGPEIRDIVYYRAIAVNIIDFLFPESFEWLILRSAIFKNISSIQEILSNPIDL